MKNKEKYRIVIYILGLVLILLLPMSLLFKKTSKQEVQAVYVGKENCKDCHQTEFEDWLGSDHDKAMDLANNSTVLGDFDNAELNRNDQIHRFYKKGEAFYVFTDGEEGEMEEFQIKYVFGHYPLQQYLVEFDRGRLQTLALTWNSKESYWYYMADSIYKDLNVDHTNWLHWTNQAQNWNSMCADCHSTNLEKNFDPITNSYTTSWSEIDVSCEACHGPASKHVSWSKLPQYAQINDSTKGLVIKTSGITNHDYVDNCARCHSRRSTSSDFRPHSNSIYDHMQASLSIEPNFHIDGQIKEEDYVYASFTQSKMYMHDVKCNDCHNVHSGKLLFNDNQLCLQCHKSLDYNYKSHHHHKEFGEKGDSVISDAGQVFEVGSATLCVHCHMPDQMYMGADFRRDHSMRIPRPDISIKMGTPNACIQCHSTESNEWAQNNVEKWYGKDRSFHFSEALFETHAKPKETDSVLRQIIYDDLFPPSIRSIAIGYLSDSEENIFILKKSLLSLNPTIRLAALKAWTINSPESLKEVLHLLVDETKSLRIESAFKLSQVGREYIPENSLNAHSKALEEYKESLIYNSDFPTGKYNLANYYYQNNDLQNAEKYYLWTIKQDEEIHAAKINLAHLYSKMNQPHKAEDLLKSFNNQVPNHAEGLYNLGLILSENGKYKESLKHLLKANQLPNNNPRIDYNIAMLYGFFKEGEKAENYLLKAIQKSPDELIYYQYLLQYYKEHRQNEKTSMLIKEMNLKLSPSDDLKSLIQSYSN